MKKYNTRPIDFTGCHPVIAEHLKRGEAIECRVWDSRRGCDEGKCYVTGYEPGIYITSGGFKLDRAEPIARKVKRIMPPERAIPILIAEGYQFDSAGYLSGPEFILSPHMYAFMGGDLDGEASEFAWPPCIIEEVEDDE